MRDRIEKIIYFFLNPRLLLCLGIGWMITNGWAYVMMGIGTLFGIGWMIAVSGGWLALLWVPFTPEKIVTVAIAIWLLRLFFPKDEKTLAVLRGMWSKAVSAVRKRKNKDKDKEK